MQNIPILVYDAFLEKIIQNFSIYLVASQFLLFFCQLLPKFVYFIFQAWNWFQKFFFLLCLFFKFLFLLLKIDFFIRWWLLPLWTKKNIKYECTKPETMLEFWKVLANVGSTSSSISFFFNINVSRSLSFLLINSLNLSREMEFPLK